MVTVSVKSSAVKGALSKKVIEDHEEMYEYFDKYMQAVGKKDEQERWSRQLIWEVARHAVGEELVVYPLMQDLLGVSGKALADQDRAEHQVVKKLLYALESLTPGSSEYTLLLQEVMKHLKKHNDGEEQDDLPALELALGEEKSVEASLSFQRTKKFAPTRPHPSAPNKPPFENVAGLLAAPLDMIRDLFSKFPTEEMKQGD